MKNLFVSLCAAVAGMVLCSHAEEPAETIDTVVDYVALCGYSPEGLFRDFYRTTGIEYTFDGEGQVWKTRRIGAVNWIESDSTIVDFEGMEHVFKILCVNCKNDAWQGPCIQYECDSGVILKAAQTVKIPYYCSGGGLVGGDLRIIVKAGVYSFSVSSEEKISAGQWNVATFKLSDAFATASKNYAESCNAVISRLRIYFANQFNNPTASSEGLVATGLRFTPGSALYFGPVTYSYENISSYSVSLDTNGGEPIDDLQTDENFQVTLPTPVREGFEFLGWYYSGVATAAGSTVDIVQNCTYVAGWKRIDPSAGLASLSASKQMFDLYAANGSCYQIVDIGDGITYFPEEDRYVHTSSASIVVTPVESGGVTNVKISASSGGGKWSAPSIHPRLPVLKLSDIYEVRIPYSYTGNHSNVIGKPLVFYYKIGNTWRHCEGDAVFAATDEGCKNTIRVKVGESLGADYNKLKDETISDWKFYFYGDTIGETGLSNKGWNVGGTFVFYPLILAKQTGLILLLR